MTKPSINLQELRRRIYRKAKAEKQWRFWGLYVHVCKMESLRAAYQEAKANDGAPGLDGESFEFIETQGVEKFLTAIREELLSAVTTRARTGGWRFPRAMVRPAGSEFPPSRIELFREQ